MTPFTTEQLLDAVRRALTTADDHGGTFAICVVDDGGHVLLHARQPAATVGAADSALAKARTAVWLGADTGAVPPTAAVVPALTAGVPWPVAVFPGGLALRSAGAIVGAVGVGGSVDPALDLAVARAAGQGLTAALGE